MISGAHRRPSTKPSPQMLRSTASAVRLTLCLLWFVLVAPVALAESAIGVASDRVVLDVGGVQHEFTAEIADDPIERGRGLMFREEMASDHGMLFDFGREQRVAFWMENTPLSLDMIFVREDGEIVRIERDAVPFSREMIPSGEPVRFVFEVVAGTSDRIGLKPGDRLRHPRVTQAR